MNELYDGEHGMTERQAEYITLIENMIDKLDETEDPLIGINQREMLRMNLERKLKRAKRGSEFENSLYRLHQEWKPFDLS